MHPGHTGLSVLKAEHGAWQQRRQLPRTAHPSSAAAHQALPSTARSSAALTLAMAPRRWRACGASGQVSAGGTGVPAATAAAASAARVCCAHARPPPPLPPALPDLYRGVLSVVLGQQLPPDTGTNFPSQGFAVAVSVVGLTSFALVLALMEQGEGRAGQMLQMPWLCWMLAARLPSPRCCFRPRPRAARPSCCPRSRPRGAGAQRAAGQRGVRGWPRGCSGLVRLRAGAQPAAAHPGAAVRGAAVEPGAGRRCGGGADAAAREAGAGEYLR